MSTNRLKGAVVLANGVAKIPEVHEAKSKGNWAFCLGLGPPHAHVGVNDGGARGA
jgi:hypothetical protein